MEWTVFKSRTSDTKVKNGLLDILRDLVLVQLNTFVSDEMNTALYNKAIDYDESVIFKLILLLTLANLI